MLQYIEPKEAGLETALSVLGKQRFRLVLGNGVNGPILSMAALCRPHCGNRIPKRWQPRGLL